MARLIEFNRRSTAQLQKILSFYDERNGSDVYSRRLLKELMGALHRVALMPTASSPSTRPDVRFIYLMGFTVIFRYNTQKVTLLAEVLLLWLFFCKFGYAELTHVRE